MKSPLGHILYAAVARLRQADLRRIMEASEAAWFAQANYGMSGQIDAQEHELRVCQQAVENMVPSDRAALLRIAAVHLEANVLLEQAEATVEKLRNMAIHPNHYAGLAAAVDNMKAAHANA